MALWNDGVHASLKNEATTKDEFLFNELKKYNQKT